MSKILIGTVNGKNVGFDVLNGSEAKLIDILHRSRETWSKEQLGQESGFSHTSGGFNNYLGHMRTLGFVEYPAPGQVKAADWLYL